MYTTILSLFSKNGTNQSENSFDTSTYLNELQEEEFQLYIPTMTMLLFISVIGVVGNTIVLVVYSKRFKRNPTRIFIMAIAVFDLISNTLCIPGEVYDMHNLWTYKYSGLCGLFHFSNATTTITSASVLLALCIARYRMICQPFKKQMTEKQAKITSVCIALFGAIVSLPYGIISGLHSRPTDDPLIYGRECTTSDEYIDTIWPLVNTGLFLLVFFGVCTPLVVLYLLIGIKAYAHRKTNYRLKTPLKSYSQTATFTSSITEEKNLSESKEHERVNKTPEDEAEGKQLCESKRSPKFSLFCCKLKATGGKTRVKNNRTKSHEKNNEVSLPQTQLESISSSCSVENTGGEKSNDDILKQAGQCLGSSTEKSKASDGFDLKTIYSISMKKQSSNHMKNQMNCQTEEEDDNQVSGDDIENHGLTGAAGVCDIFSDSDNKGSEINTTEADVSECSEEKQPENEQTQRFPPQQGDEQLQKQHHPSSYHYYHHQQHHQDYHQRHHQHHQPSQQEEQQEHRPKIINRTTAMLIIITSVYVTSYIPYLILGFFRFSQPEKYAAMADSSKTAYYLFLRTYFINSAANAIIYSLCDKKFRQHLIDLRWKCTRVI